MTDKFIICLLFLHRDHRLSMKRPAGEDSISEIGKGKGKFWSLNYSENIHYFDQISCLLE